MKLRLTSPSGANCLIRCEDALAALKHIRNNSIRIVVTSPPYNSGQDYDGLDDRLPWPDYLAYQQEVARELYRVLTDDGHAFLEIKGDGQNRYRPHAVLGLYRQERFALQNEIARVWSITIDDKNFGRHNPTTESPRFFRSMWAPIFHFTKTGNEPLDKLSIGVPLFEKWKEQNQARFGSRDLRDRGNVWFIPYHSEEKDFDHPCPFPLDLPLWCIKVAGAKGVVLDPFCGSGTTLLAAAQLGLSAIGIDRVPDYCTTAHNRLKEVLS